MTKPPKTNYSIFEPSEKLSKPELLKVANNLQMLLELNKGGILVYDSDETILFANDMAGQLAGISAKKMLGLPLSSFFKDVNLEMIRDLKVVSERGLDPFRPTIRMVSGETDQLDVQVSFIPMEDALSGLNYLHIRDRTERVITENMLRDTAVFFKKLIDSTVDGIVAADTKGHIILFNRGAELLLGYNRYEALHKMHVGKLYPQGEAQRIMTMLRSEKYGGAGRCFRQRIKGLTKDGQELSLSLSGSIIYNEDGRETASVGIFTDLSEIEEMYHTMHQQREALVAAEKLSSIGKLAAGVAHEINNPLTGILAFIEDLIDEADKDDPRLEDYEVIHRETIRCREIVKNLLDFGRQQPPEMVPNEINEIILRTVRLVTRLPHFRNTSIQADLAENLKQVVCDPSQIQQVFINLLINASEAMPEGGTVKLTSRSLPDPERVELLFTDTGEGMDENVRSQIFEPFYSTKGGKTNGLGLAVSWGIIERHGGQIEVQSKVGEGTTFRILLPTLDKDADA